MRILQQVEQGLFDLDGIEARDRIRNLALKTAGNLGLQASYETPPVHGLGPRCGQAGKACVLLQESIQVSCPFADRFQYLRQAFGLAAPHQFPARMRQ